MQKRNIAVALALLIIAPLLLVPVSGQVVQGQDQNKLVTLDPQNIDTMYHAVVVTGMSSDSLTFNILNTVIKGKDGSVLTKDLAPPQSVQYFYANDTLKLGDENRTKLVEFGGFAKTDYNTAIINVAGASAVMAAKNFSVSPKDSDIEFRVTGFYMYLPDGTVKSYKLDTPASVVISRDQRIIATTSNPQFGAGLQDSLKGDAKFPADAAPVRIKDIDSKIQ